jgi:hypothetical protein
VEVTAEHVDDRTNHMRVVYRFRPFVFEGIDGIEVKGATLLPQKVIDAIIRDCLPSHEYRVDIGVMDKVRERIEKWYQDKGLPFCYVGFFDGMDEGVLRANVIEAKVNDVSVRYERPRPGDDSDHEAYAEGEVVPADKIIAAAGFKARPRPLARARALARSLAPAFSLAGRPLACRCSATAPSCSACRVR